MRLIGAEDIKDYWVESEGSKEEFIKENMPDDADYTEYSEFFDKMLQAFKNVVDTSPTIDAVPVVRCKNCRFGTQSKQEPKDHFVRCIHNPFYPEHFHKNHYCGFGAKMDEEAEQE